MSKTYKLKGQWKGKSAGGCQNHPTWRYNPQLFLSVPEETTVRITLAQDASSSSSSQGGANHIGFYVARADNPDRRQLIIGRQNLVAKAKFEGKEEVSADAVLPAGPTYVVIPCTFNPGCEGGFTISFTAEVSLNLAPLPPSKEWKYISCLGSWESRSAGGCRNHPSCIRNPQFLLRVRRSGDFTILLSQTKEKFDAVGFYVVATKDPEFMLTEINSSDIVAKADFARPSEAIVTASLDKKVQYVIVPCTFDPGFESEFKLEIFGDSDIRLKALKSRKEVELQGEWLGATAGGCINHPTWRNNPQYFLFMRQTATVTITLVQDGGDDHSVGFYVVKTTGNRVIILAPNDILGKGAFERKKEVSCELTLEAAQHPYCIIPCTFAPNLNKKFTILVNVQGDKPTSEVLRLLPCNYVWAKKAIRHEWLDGKSGGCRNSPETWLNNPICQLELLEDGELVFLLSQPKVDKSIGFYVVGKKNEQQPLSNSNVSKIFGKSSFRKDYEVSSTSPLTKGTYQIIPCTFNPDEVGGFTLSIYSSVSSFELEAVNFVPLHGGDQLKKKNSSSSSSAETKSTTGDWELGKINWSDVKIGKKIGQGGYGAVYLGEWQNRKVAIKKLFRDEVDDSELAIFRKEIEIMSKFSHSKIVQFLGASLQQPNICILTEFMDRGNLSQVLKADPNLPWSRKLGMALDASDGMEYLHSQIPPVVHRDLKSLNLLVAEDFTVKVADFGLSKATSGNSLNSKVGSLNWCAPEILLQSAPYTKAGDVYSFGMVLWEIVTHEAPFANMHPLQIVRSIDQGELPTIPNTCEENFTTLTRKCWSKDPQLRPDFVSICKLLRHLIEVENSK